MHPTEIKANPTTVHNSVRTAAGYRSFEVDKSITRKIYYYTKIHRTGSSTIKTFSVAVCTCDTRKKHNECYITVTEVFTVWGASLHGGRQSLRGTESKLHLHLIHSITSAPARDVSKHTRNTLSYYVIMALWWPLSMSVSIIILYCMSSEIQ